MTALTVKWLSDDGSFGAPDSSRGMSPGKDAWIQRR